MAKVTFFEKPGCQGNARQRKLLTDSGHWLEIHDLLSHPWTPETLRPFLGDKPVAEWFNKSARAVKNGEIDPTAFSADAALMLLAECPLLIRRPLMEAEGRKACGFDAAEVNAWIGLKDLPETNAEACAHGHAEGQCQGHKDDGASVEHKGCGCGHGAAHA